MRLILILSLVALVSGCTSITPQATKPPVPVNWETHHANIVALNQWQFNGRLFIQTPDDGFSAELNWQQDKQNSDLQLKAPFGQGTYKLSSQPDQFSIQFPDQSTKSAENAEQLMNQTLGWAIPVQGLVYWFRGIPDPTEPERKIILDTNDRMLELQQSGWTIKIQQYFLTEGRYLPKKLTLTNRLIKLKLAVKHWALQ